MYFRDGLRIHAVDKTGHNLTINDGDMVEKFTMSDDVYDKREGMFSFVRHKH